MRRSRHRDVGHYMVLDVCAGQGWMESPVVANLKKSRTGLSGHRGQLAGVAAGLAGGTP